MNRSKTQKTRGRALARFSAVAFVALSVFLVAPASFAVADNDGNLLKLEEKFFQHTYPKESIDARLDRIEKMVFGEAKDGDDAARLSALVQAVPNLNSASSDSPPAQTARGGNSSSGGASGRQTAPAPVADEEESEPAPIGNYPAVDAIERKAFNGKTYSQEPVNQRLARLETKYFGKPSSSTDLTDRTDRLKAQSGIDITKNAPLNADWADEDDEDPTSVAPPQPVARRNADKESFSGRNMADDFRRQGIIPKTSMGGSGMYGGMGSSGGAGSRMGSGSYGGGSYGSGSYGMGAGAGTYGGSSAPAPRARPPITSQDFEDDDDDDIPPPRTAMAAPRTAPTMRPSTPQAQGMGLNSQVTLMENEVFSKTFSKDPLPTRLHRLEQSLFPAEKPWTDKSLPERVNRLAGVIQISPGSAQGSPRVAQSPQPAPSFNDDGYPPTAPSMRQRKNGGLGKIINSIGNLIGGGFVGGYPMQSGNVVTDPRTGLLLDTVTGNLIDPATGMVISQRPVQRYGTGYGSGVGTFGNGFSTGGFGIGTGGVRFGGGGMGMPMGGYGFGGGMWP